jgi:hypothetical protein
MNSPEAGVCVLHLHAHCSCSQICCCWMSPPTISISLLCCGCSRLTNCCSHVPVTTLSPPLSPFLDIYIYIPPSLSPIYLFSLSENQEAHFTKPRTSHQLHRSHSSSVCLQYLMAYDKTVIIVSHDRQFLDNVVTDIVHAHGKKLDYYHTNYTAFVKVCQVHRMHALTTANTHNKGPFSHYSSNNIHKHSTVLISRV